MVVVNMYWNAYRRVRDEHILADHEMLVGGLDDMITIDDYNMVHGETDMIKIHSILDGTYLTE